MNQRQVTLGQITDVMNAAQELAPLEIGDVATLKAKIAAMPDGDLRTCVNWITALRRVAKWQDLKSRCKFYLIIGAFFLFWLCVCAQHYTAAYYDYDEAHRIMESESMRYSTLTNTGIATEADRRRLVDARAVYLRAETKWKNETWLYWAFPVVPKK